jgi:very-short-patch-repair endonuclease
MRVAEKMLNKAEELAFRELDSIAQDNALRLFAKPRLSDVILKDSPLSQADFDFYTRAHVDFVVTDDETKPLFIVEYDGPFHAAPVQQRRDRTKDGLCADAGLGILRINANHVTKLYRGMSVLRWIIEVTELEKWFDEAQAAGHVPFDEPFDAAMIMQDGKGRKWPYWLSVSATQSLNAFVFDRQKPTQRGWAGIVGTDAENNLLELSYCWFDDRVIWSKTGVRRQNFQFPAYDLLREISICELELKVREHKAGKLQAISGAQMQQICRQFCSRYDAHPSHSCGGAGPVNYSWSYASGWKFP